MASLAEKNRVFRFLYSMCRFMIKEMIDAASMETDREKRLQTYRDLQVRLNELCPWVPLYYKSNMVGRRADLRGF